MSERSSALLAAAMVLALAGHPGVAGDIPRAGPSQACGGIGPNLVQDGGFEAPSVRGADYYVVSRGGAIGQWTVSSGTVDFIACGFWQAAEGCQSVDLNSCEAGSLEQRLWVKKGRRYSLCFSLAGNSDRGPRRKVVEVCWAGGVIDSIAFDTTNTSRRAMGWDRHRYSLTAPSDSVVLRFRSLTDGCYGPVVDDVVVRELDVQLTESLRADRQSFMTRASSSVRAGTTWYRSPTIP